MLKSNFYIAKSVVERVYASLSEKNLLSKYEDIFDQQLAEGILEPVDLKTIDVNSCVWIPHRPVIKQDENVTTKIRIVLNCSFKIGNSLSINQCAFPGLDLFSDLLGLLLNVRSNRFCVLADIRQAFLQIKLSEESDRNIFSILWKKGEDLIAYRYQTIVFGFISSPFILHFVIKNHLSKFPMDECTKVLLSNLYVDNLFFTGNSELKLEDLYKLSYERMLGGGFELRSWASNNAYLNECFSLDNRGVSHNSGFEKMLGYLFSTRCDKIKLADFSIEISACPTKRFILSQISKIYDPLGLYFPVTVRGKVLMREIWCKKLECKGS